MSRRRRSKRYRQKLRKAIIAWIILIALVILVIVLLFIGVKALIKLFSKEADTPMTAINSVVTEGVLNSNDIEPTPSPTPSPVPSLAQSITDGNGNTLIHDIPVWTGYTVSGKDTAAYISSAEVQSTYGILIDASNGQIVCQKEGLTRINPASMTKIMTVLVAAEHLTEEDLDKQVTITQADTGYAYENDLSCVGFANDETVSVKDLFYGTILPSGADAAMALARYVAGDEATFIGMMNDKITQLGLANTTHFTNCVGLYDTNHYSTCADMALILKATIENEFCYEVLNTHKYTTSKTAEHPEGIEISNWFLRRIEDKDTGGEVLCAKTGYVNQSGSCAASFSYQKNGKPYLCVTAQAHSAWRCIYDQVDIYKNNAR